MGCHPICNKAHKTIKKEFGPQNEMVVGSAMCMAFHSYCVNEENYISVFDLYTLKHEEPPPYIVGSQDQTYIGK